MDITQASSTPLPLDGTAPPARRVGRGRVGRLALAGASLLVAAALVMAPDRLPSWRWTMGGVTTELGPGKRAVDLGAIGANPATRPPTGARGRQNALDPANISNAGNSGLNSGGTRRTFTSYADAEDYAGKAASHVLQARWLPDGYALESVSVTLSQLPPEMIIAFGRPQRVAIVQRLAAADGSINVVQSSPPPVFDVFMEPGREEDTLQLSADRVAQFGVYPQGVVVFWHERDEARSVALIGDPGAAARLTRDDWLRLANALT